MHRPTERETLAVWSEDSRPFLDDGSLGATVSVQAPVVVVSWSTPDQALRLYQFGRTAGGAVTGTMFTPAGVAPIHQPAVVARTIGLRVGRRERP